MTDKFSPPVASLMLPVAAAWAHRADKGCGPHPTPRRMLWSTPEPAGRPPLAAPLCTQMAGPLAGLGDERHSDEDLRLWLQSRSKNTTSSSRSLRGPASGERAVLTAGLLCQGARSGAFVARVALPEKMCKF